MHLFGYLYEYYVCLYFRFSVGSHGAALLLALGFSSNFVLGAFSKIC
jgi:hypothetical protein